jgi:hypothetical protein
VWRNLLVTGDESVLLMIRNTYMKRLMVLILMVVLSMPAFVLADVGGSKGNGKTHTDNGKHKGWYKDGHKHGKHGKNVAGKRHWKKKTGAPYASGTVKRPSSTVSNGGVAKNTGGASVKRAPTTSEGGVIKGSGTMSHTGGSVKVTTSTTSQGGTTKN